MIVKIHNDLLNFVRPSAHSTFSPSASDRWMECPFSIEATKNIPNETSKYAEEGTLAHSVCEAEFAKEFFGIGYPNDLQMKIIALEDEGAEMMDSAYVYISCIKAWLNLEEEIGNVLSYGLEKGIPIFAEEGAFGTADTLIIGDKGCAVIDFKYGKGKSVNADSLQLRTYLAGVLKHLIDVPEDYRFHSVIVQPRTDYAPKAHTYTKAEIKDHLEAVWNAIQETKKSNLEPVRGKHCFWCPASRTKDSALKCPAIKTETLKVAQEDFGKFMADMSAPVEKFGDNNDKRDSAIIKVMSLLPLMQKIAKDGEEEFAYRISKGENIPGVQITEKAGNRTWLHTDENEMKGAIQKLYPKIDPIKTVTKLMTITEFEKQAGKKSADALTYKPLNKKLVVQDAKVQEILGDLAKCAQALEE